MAPTPRPLIDVACSAARLDPRANQLAETVIPRFARAAGFERDDDAATVIADIFRDAGGDRILVLVRSLGRFWNPVHALSIRCANTGRALPATHFPDHGIKGPEWFVLDAPATVSALEIGIGGQRIFRPVQPNLSRLFAGRRVLVTMCRDEPIERIVDWAQWHADRHGFDGVLYYDNGSTANARTEVAAALNSIPGIAVVAAVDWPGVAWLQISEFPWVGVDAWSQRASIRHAALRFLQRAECMLCCDVDELLVSFDPEGDGSVASLLADDAVSAVRFWSQEVVSPGELPPSARHRDVYSFARKPHGKRVKWLARPARIGPDHLPHQHDPAVEGTVTADPRRMCVAHFRPLTTSWGGRARRLRPSPADAAFAGESRELRRQLDEVFGRWSWSPPPVAPPSLDDLCREAWMLIDAGDHLAALDRIEAALAEEPRQPALAAARRRLLDQLPPEPGS